jgi:lipoprotein signal peptidase
MFIPIAGAALGMFILFNTGVALGAIAATQGYPVYVGFLSLVATPIFWIEFVAYSIAMAESIWLFRRLTQKRWLEFKWTALFIGSCAGLLAIGAVVEAWLITVLG